MNFFDPNCQQGPYTATTFGLCDPENGGVAYVDAASRNQQQWIATVENPSQQAVTFTAIDKCVIQDGDEPGRGRCDGMLTTQHLLYLVELKDQRKVWQTHAIEQLESTIQFLLAAHPDVSGRFRHKKAFACNKKHPAFVSVDHDEQQRFYKSYGFRLDLQATVVVVD